VLDLYEGPGPGPGLEDRAGSKVTEGTDGDTCADRRVDGDGVRADLRPGGDPGATAKDGERMDGRVRLDLDGGVDPRRRRVDDGHAREHVPLVEAVAKDRRGTRQLGAVVDPERGLRLGAAVGLGAAAAGDDRGDRVGEIELSLRVRRVEARERRPE